MTADRNARRHRDNRQTSTSTLVLAAIIAAAAVIIALCWRPWVDFGISHLDGNNADAVTGIGDGYFVAVFAASIVVLAAALILRPGRWAWLLPAIGAAAIAIALIAGYDAGTAWHVVGVDIQGAFVAGGHATAAVYEVLALALAIALLAAILAGLQYQNLRDSSVGIPVRPKQRPVRKEQVMIKRILAPLDGSGLAERAIPYASRIAARTQAELLLLAAVVPGEHWVGLATANPSDPQELEAAGEYLQSVAKPLRTHGLAVRTQAVSGRAASAICAAAEDAECDLIVMTTQGRAGLDRWMVGSVADKVRHTSAKPVLLVHGHQEIAPEVSSATRILVPLDGSELAELVLPFVEEIAAALGASLVLQQVVVPPAALYASEYLPSALPALNDVEAAAKSYLTKLALGIRATGLAVDVRVDVGLPSQAIIDLADSGEIDIIAMMTHGRTGPSRLIMGSVADSVSRHVDVPCLIVPGRVVWDKDQKPERHARVGADGQPVSPGATAMPAAAPRESETAPPPSSTPAESLPHREGSRSLR